MMPKEVLTDRAIRAEVVPGLSLRIICHVLGRFHPDDLASDPLPPGAAVASHTDIDYLHATCLYANLLLLVRGAAEACSQVL